MSRVLQTEEDVIELFETLREPDVMELARQAVQDGEDSIVLPIILPSMEKENGRFMVKIELSKVDIQTDNTYEERKAAVEELAYRLKKAIQSGDIESVIDEFPDWNELQNARDKTLVRRPYVLITHFCKEGLTVKQVKDILKEIGFQITYKKFSDKMMSDNNINPKHYKSNVPVIVLEDQTKFCSEFWKVAYTEPKGDGDNSENGDIKEETV